MKKPCYYRFGYFHFVPGPIQPLVFFQCNDPKKRREGNCVFICVLAERMRLRRLRLRLQLLR